MARGEDQVAQFSVRELFNKDPNLVAISSFIASQPQVFSDLKGEFEVRIKERTNVSDSTTQEGYLRYVLRVSGADGNGTAVVIVNSDSELILKNWKPDSDL